MTRLGRFCMSIFSSIWRFHNGEPFARETTLRKLAISYWENFRNNDHPLMWCPELVTKFHSWFYNLMATSAGSFVIGIAFFTYYFVPPYLNSLTIGAMSLERYLLICHPTIAKHSWFFNHRKILYSVLSVIFFGVPMSVGLYQNLCPVILHHYFSYQLSN